MKLQWERGPDKSSAELWHEGAIMEAMFIHSAAAFEIHENSLELLT